MIAVRLIPLALVCCVAADPGPAPQWPPTQPTLVDLRTVGAASPACEAHRPADRAYVLYAYAELRPVTGAAAIPWDAWASEFAAPVWPSGTERIRIGAPELDADTWVIPFTFTLEDASVTDCVWPGVVDLLAPEVTL